eukprot:15475311-Alexandrium_andersonii.AAC.1
MSTARRTPRVALSSPPRARRLRARSTSGARFAPEEIDLLIRATASLDARGYVARPTRVANSYGPPSRF